MAKQQITIKDVAKLANVSVATAGRALGNYGSVSDEAIRRVQKAAQQLSFTPNAFAQSLRRSHMRTLGVVLSDISNPFFSRLLYGIEKAAHENDYAVIACNTNEDIDTEIKQLKMLHNKRVDGILLAAAYRVGDSISEENMYLYDGDIPVIYIDREVFPVESSAVSVDNIRGCYEAVKYLLDLGHKNIGVIAPFNIITVESRIAGCRQAVQEANLPPENCHIIRYDAKSANNSQTLQPWLQENDEITAIITLNSDSLLQLLTECKNLGKTIPSDYSVICWDDCDLAKYWEITVIEQPTIQMGKIAVERVLSQINAAESNTNNEKTLLPVTLHLRKSCKRLSF